VPLNFSARLSARSVSSFTFFGQTILHSTTLRLREERFSLWSYSTKNLGSSGWLCIWAHP